MLFVAPLLRMTVEPGLCIARRARPRFPVTERSEESKASDHSALRSTHSGFSDTMSATFLYRFHPFICFSRAMADITSVVYS